MEEWIRDLISKATSGIRALVDAIWERFAWLHSWILGILITLKNSFGILVTGAVHFLNKTLTTASEVFKTLYWVAFVRLPQAIAAANNAITKWASSLVASARDYAKQLYNSAIKWTIDRIADLRAFANSISEWARTRVAELISAIGRLNRVVFTLLATPERLATWVFDALVTELWRYLDRNADRIFTYIRQRTILYTLRFADRLEDMISRLL